MKTGWIYVGFGYRSAMKPEKFFTYDDVVEVTENTPNIPPGTPVWATREAAQRASNVSESGDARRFPKPVWIFGE